MDRGTNIKKPHPGTKIAPDSGVKMSHLLCGKSSLEIDRKLTGKKERIVPDLQGGSIFEYGVLNPINISVVINIRR